MAYSFFLQPHIRLGLHHIIATLLFSLYAMRVSPQIDAIPFITVLFQAGAFFLVLYLLRFSFYIIGSKTSAIADISLYTLAGLIFAGWHNTFYQFPLESNVKVVFGFILIGSLITIDLAFAQARIEQENPRSFAFPPRSFVPLAVQVGFGILFYVVSLVMLLSLIAGRELLWVVQFETAQLDINAVNQIMRAFLLVGAIFAGYAIIITRNALALVQRQLAYQVQALSRAAEQDFEAKVPMNTLGEFSIIAYYTNTMLHDLANAANQKNKAYTKQQAAQEQAQASDSANQSRYREEKNIDDGSIITNLASLIAARDGASRTHLMRIQRYVKALAVRLAAKEDHKETLCFETISLLYQSAPLYDIGKIAIPDNILKKPNKLTNNQLEIVKTHAKVGADILDIQGKNDKFYQMASQLALTHHEWWDGSGYPQHLAGNDIPLMGRIMALADVYNALISKKAYRAAFEHETAKEMILALSGKQFDPAVVEAFIEAEHQFIDINNRYRDELLYTLVS